MLSENSPHFQLSFWTTIGQVSFCKNIIFIPTQIVLLVGQGFFTLELFLKFGQNLPSASRNKYQKVSAGYMEHSRNHYLGKSRAVLQIDDPEKLRNLLAEQKAELQKLSVGFGRKRMTFTGAGKEPVKNKKAIKNTRRSIARICTRLSQLRQQKNRANN